MTTVHFPFSLTLLISSVALTGGLPRAEAVQPVQQARVALPGPRFVVVANPGTVPIGKPSTIDVELRNAAGTKMNASGDIPVTVTVTTATTLEAAKRDPAPATAPPAKPASLDKQRVTLPTNVQTRQVRAIFPRGQGDVEFNFTAGSRGLIRVFIEAPGIETGSTLIAATDKLMMLPKAKSDESDVQRVSFRQDPPLAQLVIEESGRNVLRRGGELTQTFYVRLATEDGDYAGAPSDLLVNLLVIKGRARFEPRSLTIPTNEAVSREPAELRSSLGGALELEAGTALAAIAKGRLPYTFEPGVRTTALVITPLSRSALANGLDEIPIEVKAVYRGAGQEIVMRAADEGLDERRVSFSFAGGSARRDGTNELVIKKEDQTATARLVASSPSRDLVIEAHSVNGLAENVLGTETVDFILPWLQLLAAAIGGLMLPAILRKGVTKLLLGALGGVIFYVLMFFGAVVTGIFQLGSVAVALTKLPSENLLAASVLGLIGYLATRSALSLQPATASQKRT